ncbi:MAG TPA: hypothetical protein VFZ34_03155 [Blastocatellia bacterium]|nr:hypothetical protein [Blastocatellia bacterium]
MFAMKNPDPEILRSAIFEIIHNQIRDNNPPETKATLERLLADEIPEEEALKMIGCCVTTEIFDILKYHRTFDEARYVRNLHRLPQLPWE